ncbi:MAG: CHAT domain-containing protein [Chitinophagaceae bacterium]|nr:CHAT domain-containing protein [Chitinophagaceae bacterium]
MFRKAACLIALVLCCTCNLYSQQWQVYRDSAEYFRQHKLTDSAIYYYELTRGSLPDDSAQSDTHIDLLTSQASLMYLGKSQYAASATLYLQARQIILGKYGKENDLYAGNAGFLGQVFYFLKKYQQAESMYLEAREIYKHLHTDQSKEYAGICNALGILYNDNAEFEKAEAAHLEARAIREKLFTRENGAYAQSCNNLAAIYWNLGQYDKAEPLAIEARDIRARVTGIPKSAYAISCINLANIYRDMGKFQQAEPLYKEARQVRENYFTKDHDDYALSCDILADLYLMMHEYEKAEPLYLEAKAIREKINSGTSFFYGQGCSSLSNLYRETGRYTEAESYALEAAKIWQGIGEMVKGDMAVNDNSLGELYFDMKRYDESEKYFLKARLYWKQNLGEEHPYFTGNSVNLARVYWNENKIPEAAGLYRSAFETQQVQARRMFSFTSEEEKQLYLKNIAGAGDEYQSFYFNKLPAGNNGQPYVISLQKRNQILSSSRQLRQSIFSSGDSALLRKYDAWTSLKKQIAALYSKGDDAPKEHMHVLMGRADSLEKELVRQSGDFKKSQSVTADWKNIRQFLKAGEAAIEFISFDMFDGRDFTDSVQYAALLLRKNDTEPVLVPLFTKSRLEKQLSLKSINPPATIGLIYGSDSLYNIIWKPLVSKLEGITKIYFAPTGLLHRVSLSGIRMPDKRYLGDKYEMSQLLTTASVTDTVSPLGGKNTRLLLYGDVSYNADTVLLRQSVSKYAVDPGITRSVNGDFETGERGVFFEPLPASAREIDAIAGLAKSDDIAVTSFKGVDANEESVKSWSGNADPLILHITTHGFFYPDPVKSARYAREQSGKAFKRSDNPLFRSGLILAGAENTWAGKPVQGVDDGVLTAYEIANMYFPHARLVTLSACETALGDIRGSEGVYGLQRAFKMAGFQYLVMSLWKVPDTETAEFMEMFYNNLFSGKSIAESFTRTQGAMRDKYRDKPFNWAAWVLVK